MKERPFPQLALAQSKWTAACLDCRFRDVTAAAPLTGPRHSRDAGHRVDVTVELSGRFLGGLPEEG